ncbi:apicomplexan-specific protein, putative [Perkinsus marinus ATCC 50983]|uniref:Apicomplexan-specific protein, putative n=1 Tax=Perkinsus marinus (strain ATCC 50983 / TXsc) TaxID=423536 RepID=C5LDE5_PERM5|nr:apicomplexan-specific protein, putative [Perkinsus marinus ATCC 50983]EER05277.1 apicomplexan-specific protein, putative [Perkinsus marinus ATCC 50983]|eukprot:XP_002773461.1 apicomplexan-specific protein, putative [Perkinsus marinus ATCC 50983]
MFFGIALKGGESQTMDEVNADMVHLTQACLVDPKTDSRCEIQVKETEGESFTIAVLTKGSSDALSLDLTFSPADPPTFVNKGKEEVHLTGCYEFYDVEGEEDEEEESEIDEAEMNETLNTKLTEMIKEKAKEQGIEVEESDDDDEEEEEEEEEDVEVEEVESEGEEEPAAAEESSPKKAESPKKPSPKKAESPKKPSPKKAESPKKPSPKTTEVAKEEKKRKLSVDESSPKTSKPAKAAKKDGNKVEDDYAKSIVEFLTKNGRTNVGQLGSKCRKPASVSKLSTFIKSRHEFKLSNGFIELA